MLRHYGLNAIVCEMPLAELRRSGRRGLVQDDAAWFEKGGCFVLRHYGLNGIVCEVGLPELRRLGRRGLGKTAAVVLCCHSMA